MGRPGSREQPPPPLLLLPLPALPLHSQTQPCLLPAAALPLCRTGRAEPAWMLVFLKGQELPFSQFVPDGRGWWWQKGP